MVAALQHDYIQVRTRLLEIERAVSTLDLSLPFSALDLLVLVQTSPTLISLLLLFPVSSIRF